MKAIGNIVFADEIYEIRFLQSTWQNIRKQAELHELTYSWIVRLCLFRFLRTLKRDARMHQAHRSVRFKLAMNEQPLHRHMLCLYGRDGDHLRVVAARFGLSITQFVRIAVELELEQVSLELTQGLDVVRHGTKIFMALSGIEKPVMEFHNRQVEFKHYRPGFYWAFKRLELLPPPNRRNGGRRL